MKFLTVSLLAICIALASCGKNVPDLFERQNFNNDWLFFMLEEGADLSGRDLQSDSEDMIFLYASVVDDNGTVVPDPDREILFTLEGEARVIGPNPASTEAGIAAILLKAGKLPGLLEIKASSGDLSSGSIQLEVTAIHELAEFY